MKDDIRCATCPLMKLTGRARYTRNNDHITRPRGECFCKHPDAQAAFELACPRSPRMAGFIAYTVKDTDEPNITTTPKWCPRKMSENPVEISRQQAEQVIDTRKPHGLFFMVGEVVTGIDNRTGDVWTEDFATKRECLKWLKNRDERERG